MTESRSWLKTHSWGIGLCVLIFTLAYGASWGMASILTGFNPFTASVLAIIFGIIVANTAKPGASFKPGITFCLKSVLRVAIILIGIRLSLMEVGELGAAGFPVVLAAVITGVLGVELLGRVFGIPKKLTMLLAAGTSICGVTAVVSTAPVIDADECEIAYAVANVTLFGLLGTLVYPYLIPHFLPLGKQCGLFLGTAIHDMAQLMGAATTYKDLYHDELGFATATIAKMTRNLFLALVIPYFAWRTRDERVASLDAEQKCPPILPGFLVGFLLMSFVRTLGDYTLTTGGSALGVFSADAWAQILHIVGKEIGATWLVGFALVSVGLNLKPDIFKGLGFRPFLLGLSGALLVGLVSFISIKILF